jgi:hypothetical protein
MWEPVGWSECHFFDQMDYNCAAMSAFARHLPESSFNNDLMTDEFVIHLPCSHTVVTVYVPTCTLGDMSNMTLIDCNTWMLAGLMINHEPRKASVNFQRRLQQTLDITQIDTLICNTDLHMQSSRRHGLECSPVVKLSLLHLPTKLSDLTRRSPCPFRHSLALPRAPSQLTAQNKLNG